MQNLLYIDYEKILLFASIIFRGDYRQKLSPILKATAEKYGFSLLPVTLDGLSLPEFPNPEINHGQAESLNVKVFPSVYLVSPKTRTLSPVTFGLVSEVELKQRLVTAIQEIKSHE
jgi:conjugal transfer pilus assembly protein TraF